MVARSLIVIASLALVAGCLVDINFNGEPFRCSVERPACPPDTVCDGTNCVAAITSDASTPDAPFLDAGSDALASCGDTLCTETCESCAADCGSCVAGQLLYLTADGEESQVPIDASGSGFEVTIQNVARVDSPDGQAFSFDGTDGIVSLINAFHLETPEFAAAAFVRSTALTMLGQEVVSMGDNWGIRIVPDGNLRVFAYNGLAYDSCRSSLINLLDGNWHHVAAQRSGAELKIFVDGVAEGTCVMADALDFNFGDNFTVGQHGTGETQFAFTGDIDEVRVFDRGLSDTEVAAFAGN